MLFPQDFIEEGSEVTTQHEIPTPKWASKRLF
jgi:hypothetical protein